MVAQNAGAEAQAQPGRFPRGLGGNKGVKGTVGMQEAGAGMSDEDLYKIAFRGGFKADSLQPLVGLDRRLALGCLNGVLQAMQHRLAQLLRVA